MTLELNIFHLSKKHMKPVEDVQEEVCITDTILEEQAVQQQMQDVLTEELVKWSEEQQGAQDMNVVQGHWRKKQEILPLMIEEGTSEPQKPDLKPLPVKLKYVYMEE